MANINLSNLYSPQMQAVTGRRIKVPYQTVLASLASYARQSAADAETNKYNQSVLNQDQSQFNENQAMQQQIADEQAAQAQKASYIQGAQTLGTIAYMTKDAWLPAAKEALGVAAPKIMSAAAPAAADAAALSGTTVGSAAAANAPIGAGLAGSAPTATFSGALSAGANAVPWAALGALAAHYGGSALENIAGGRDSSNVFAQTGRTFQDTFQGIGRPWMRELVKDQDRQDLYQKTFDVFNPMGALMSGQIGTALETYGQVARNAGPAAAFDPGAVVHGIADTLIEDERMQKVADVALATLDPFGSTVHTVYNDIRNDDWGSAAANVATGGLYSVFCFAAGTPIDMANGDIFPIEDIDLFDEVEEGGMVNGKGVTLSKDLYDYEGVQVTGSHAVYEDGEWKRVKNSNKAIPLTIEGYVKVYIINNENHILIVNGIRFADYGEVTNSEDMTAQERLDYLNEHCRI
jgi:hypothetical protein